MAREEREVVMRIVERLPSTVLDWSSGLATLEPLDVIEVRPELENVAASGARYDSVYALWPCEPDVPQCGWGCSQGPSDSTFGAGFSSISTDHWRTLATDPDPEQGYVHEWLHQVEGLYRGLGLSHEELPPLHDAAQFTSTRPADEPPYGKSYAEYESGSRTWSPWYRDYMTGRLRPADSADRLLDTPIGLTPERWRRRG
jgi:hypothetical protein